jgi:dihydroorotate dehydrogenase electron transfer subunit
MMKQFIAKIISHAPVSDCFYELTFEWDPRAGAPLPGQFCTLRVSPYTAPLLRRPFAFSSYDEKARTASIMYKKRGSATELLSGKPKGGSLDVIGPLGNDFIRMLPKSAPTLFLVAGGTGFGPIVFLGLRLKKMGLPSTMIFGCKTKSQVPRFDALSSLKPVICTDDGSEGVRGTPLTVLEKVKPGEHENAVVFSCGPSPLLYGCYEWASKRGLECFVSLEQTMACGVGACMGCAVKVTDEGVSGYARACTDGPVFNSRRIAWTSV